MFARRPNPRGDALEQSDHGLDPPSAVGAASAASSVARTITSTIVDGVVHTVAHWRVLLLGQAVSLILAVSGGTNEVLVAECGASAPATYNAFSYALIAVLGSALVRSEGEGSGDGDERDEREGFRGADRAVGDGPQGGHDDEEDDLMTDDESSARRAGFNGVTGSPDGRRREMGDHLPGPWTSKLRRPSPRPFLFGLLRIRARWYHYLAVAFIESQAYYLIFLAFRYTSFTFVYVSDALAVPSSMLFTRLIMGRRYLWTHLIGGAICIGGIVVSTVSDMNHEAELEHPSSADRIKGDVFAIAGAILLGLDDVLSEIIVSDYGGVAEMLLMKGVFGALISTVQIVILEMDGVGALFAKGGSVCKLSWRVALLVAHVVTRAIDVWGQMQFLFVSEAALLNLLLLTSDLYAAVFDAITIGLAPTPLFYVAFCLILCGIVLYEAGASPAKGQQPSTDTPASIEFREIQTKRKGGLTSSIITEHAGNMTGGADGHLT